MATKKIVRGCWVFLCLAAPVALHAAQEEAEEKYPQDFPALEAKEPEAEEAYHVCNRRRDLVCCDVLGDQAWGEA